MLRDDQRQNLFASLSNVEGKQYNRMRKPIDESMRLTDYCRHLEVRGMSRS